MSKDITTFQHLMLDIETMGDIPSSSILSIGAVEFDINTGETGKSFYRNIDLQSCFDLGLKVTASTIMWWLEQNEQARYDLTKAVSFPIIDVLREFSLFCNKDYQIWAKSPSFDCNILKDAYRKANIPISWDYRKERCVRTLTSFRPDIVENYPKSGTAHNALDDCYLQICYCSEIWQMLNFNKLNQG